MNAGHAGETVVVGRILGAWGVQGWVRVYSYTDPPEQIFEYLPWELAESDRSAEVVEWRRVGPRLVANLSQIDSPEAAAALADQPISVRRTLLPAAEPGSFYWHDLLGLEVVNLQGHRWGTIRRMLPTGAHDVMEVADDERTLLIPFVIDHFVHDVDLGAGRVRVDWPEEWES